MMLLLVFIEHFYRAKINSLWKDIDAVNSGKRIALWLSRGQKQDS